MNNDNKNFLSKLANEDPKKLSTGIVITIIICFMFPILFIFLPIVVIIAIAVSNKKGDGYSADHRTNVKGSGEGVREEILLHEKPIDYNKSTYDIYEELNNKKTDYSGVNKDLL